MPEGAACNRKSQMRGHIIIALLIWSVFEFAYYRYINR
jgi:hypothetical protein